MGTNIRSYPRSPSHHNRAQPTGHRSPAPHTASINTYKIYLASSVSRFTLVVSENSRQFQLVNGVPCDAAEPLNSGRIAFASLLWVMHWVLQFALGYKPTEAQLPTTRRFAPVSRRYRRLQTHMDAQRSVPVTRRMSTLFQSLARRLSPAQYKECLAHLSGHGRVRVYGMRYAGSVLQRRALLTCYDHGWWRMPSTSAVASGLWDVQLPPN